MSQDYNGTHAGARGTTPCVQGAFVKYGSSDGQIEGMSSGDVQQVMGAITSPPYAGTGLGFEKNGLLEASDRPYQRPYMEGGNTYGESDGQLGALREGDHADIVGAITSPPWEKGADGHLSKHNFKDPDVFAEAMAARDGTKHNRHAVSVKARKAQFERAANSDYGTTDGQIGNEERATYWSSVAQIYQQVYALLPSGGCFAVVVKDFVRKKQRVPLCDMTAQLLEAIGFTLVERAHAMLVKEQRTQTLFGDEHVSRTERKSFFRRLSELNTAMLNYWQSLSRMQQAALLREAHRDRWEWYNSLTEAQKHELNDDGQLINPRPDHRTITRFAVETTWYDSGQRKEDWNSDTRIDYEEVLFAVKQ